jgi:hypothetical protein
MEHVGDLEQECTTLEEAKAVSEQRHTERYADNDTEFDKWGGNTGIREEFETEQRSGQFKCNRRARNRSMLLTCARA